MMVSTDCTVNFCKKPAKQSKTLHIPMQLSLYCITNVCIENAEFSWPSVVTISVSIPYSNVTIYEIGERQNHC